MQKKCLKKPNALKRPAFFSLNKIKIGYAFWMIEYFQKKLQVECVQRLSTTTVILGNKHPGNLSGIQQDFCFYSVWASWLGSFVHPG